MGILTTVKSEHKTLCTKKTHGYPFSRIGMIYCVLKNTWLNQMQYNRQFHVILSIYSSLICTIHVCKLLSLLIFLLCLSIRFVLKNKNSYIFVII
jgi:hypothetical protein